MTQLWADPVTLEGQAVRLRPLELDDVPALFEAGRYSALWQWTMDNPGESESAMRSYVERALANQAAGIDLPFTQIDPQSGRTIGSTRIHRVYDGDQTLEIGWTWITPEFQRTRVNTESKYLLLCHAFEAMDALRLQLKTDDRNVVSQAAILRLGAKFEGVLRRNCTTWSGHRRSSYYYSILREEWPEVKARLEDRLSG